MRKLKERACRNCALKVTDAGSAQAHWLSGLPTLQNLRLMDDDVLGPGVSEWDYLTQFETQLCYLLG